MIHPPCQSTLAAQQIEEWARTSTTSRLCRIAWQFSYYDSVNASELMHSKISQFELFALVAKSTIYISTFCLMFSNLELTQNNQFFAIQCSNHLNHYCNDILALGHPHGSVTCGSHIAASCARCPEYRALVGAWNRPQ